MFERWADDLSAGLAEAGAPGPRAGAEDRIAAVQGALILARAGGGREAFARAVAVLGQS